MSPVDATFGGHHADAQAGVSLSMSLGPSPDVNVVNLTGSEASWAIGEIVLTDGTAGAGSGGGSQDGYIRITNMEPFAWQVRNGRDGLYTEIQIRDSRQNWQRKGAITGEYNKPFADGAENQQQSVQALVALCLAGLGESGYNVSALPNDFYPYVRWEAAKPGAEASRLCEMCNCALGLDLNGGHAKVYSLGTGSTPPSGYIEKNDLGRQKRDIPDYYLVRGAQNILQRTSTLVPVGLDTDGSIKPLTSLSYYANAVGLWTSIGAAIRDGFSLWGKLQPAWHDAAIRSCGKWFQLSTDDMKYLPALPAICETFLDTDGKAEWGRPRIAKVSEAQWRDKQNGGRWTAVNDLNHMSWEFDERRGIVRLGSWLLNPDDSVIGVQLVWAHHELNSDGTMTQANFYTYTNVSSPPSNPTVEVIPADWLQLRKILSIGGVTTIINQSALDAIAAKIITYYNPGDAYVDCAEVVYSGLKCIMPDGCIRKVTWHVGADGAFTTLIYNTERPPIGGARLQRKIEGLKKDFLIRDSASMASKWRLAGVSVPPDAHVGSHDRGGVDQGAVPEARRVINKTLFLAPAGAILWLRDGTDPTSGRPTFVQPQYPGISDIDIALDPIIPGMSGLAAHVGRPLVLLAPGLTVKPGDRLGATPGQWYATKQDLGPMTVKGLPLGGYAEVDLHRRQGDGIYVVDPAGINSGFYDAVMAGKEITVAAASVPADFSGKH